MIDNSAMAEAGEIQDDKDMEGDQMLHKDSRLQLPMSCDPPGPSNPPKQLVWIVSRAE